MPESKIKVSERTPDEVSETSAGTCEKRGTGGGRSASGGGRSSRNSSNGRSSRSSSGNRDAR